MGTRASKLVAGRLLADDTFHHWLDVLRHATGGDTALGVLTYSADEEASKVSSALEFRKAPTVVAMYEPTSGVVHATVLGYLPDPAPNHSDLASLTTVRDLFDLLDLHRGDPDWSFGVEDADITMATDMQEFSVSV